MHKYIIVWPHVDNYSLLQRGTVAKRNFPQDTSAQTRWTVFWGVQGSLQRCWRRQVWSNVFVCLSFKINVSLEDWQNCHAVTLFPYFCFLLQIWCLTWEYIVIQWKVDAGKLCPSVPLGGDSNFGFPDYVPFISSSNHQISSFESCAFKSARLTFLWVFCMRRLGFLTFPDILQSLDHQCIRKAEDLDPRPGPGLCGSGPVLIFTGVLSVLQFLSIILNSICGLLGHKSSTYQTIWRQINRSNACFSAVFSL